MEGVRNRSAYLMGILKVRPRGRAAAAGGGAWAVARPPCDHHGAGM